MYFTYLVKCIPTNQFYYGVCFKQGADSNRLWTTYFTSSKSVHRLVEEYGSDAFEVEVRRIFDTPAAARLWEAKVLKRMNVVKDARWLNQTDLHSFTPRYGDDNHAKDPSVIAKMIKTNDAKAVAAGFASFADKIGKLNPAKNPEVAKKIGAWKSGKIWVYCRKTMQQRMIDPAEENQFLANGFTRGKPQKPSRKYKGRIYINRGGKTTSILPNQLEDFLNQGWITGRG